MMGIQSLAAVGFPRFAAEAMVEEINRSPGYKFREEEKMPKMLVSAIAFLCSIGLAQSAGLFIHFFAEAHWASVYIGLTLFITFTFHELIHGIVAIICDAQPRFGFRYVFFYTAFDEFVTRNSYFLIAVMPLLFFDLILIILFFLFPLVRAYIYFAFIINTAGSIGDLWIVVTLLKHSKKYWIKDTKKGYAVYYSENPEISLN